MLAAPLSAAALAAHAAGGDDADAANVAVDVIYYAGIDANVAVDAWG